MEPQISLVHKKYILGINSKMSLVKNNTKELWQSFIEKTKAANLQIPTTLYSVEFYPPKYFTNFDPNLIFEKWAGFEIEPSSSLPIGFQTIIIPESNYAVFTYKGLPEDASPFFQFIYEEWLPKSEYHLENRPHFAEMGENYKNNDPSSQERIYIPVIRK